MGIGITGEDLQMLENRELWDLKNFSPLVAAREKCLHHLIPKFLKIENFRNQLNDPDELGMTPLLVALSECCDLSVFGAMVDSGADVSKVNSDGRSALHFAVMNGSNTTLILEIFYANLDNLHLLHSKDCKGNTPLHYAKEESIIEILMKFRANPNVRDNHGRTPLHHHLRYHGLSPDSFTFLVTNMKPESLKFVDEKGDSLLHCVCYKGLLKFISPLLNKAGIDPTLKNKEGDTPLHCALISRQTSCMRELLRGHPLLFGIVNKHKKCPLELAKDDDYKELVKCVSLQDTDIVQNCISKVTEQDLKEKILVYFEQCLSDIRLMKTYVISRFSLYDLVKKSYLKPSELSWNQYDAVLFFNHNLTVYGPEVSHVKAKVQDSIPKPILQRLIIVSESVRASTSNLSLLSATPSMSQDQVINLSATQVKAGEMQQNTPTPLIPTVKNEIANKGALTSDLYQHSTLRPLLRLFPFVEQVRAEKVKVVPEDSAAQVKAKELQQNTVARLITNVKYDIVNDRALTSDSSQVSKIGPSATKVKAEEMQKNTLTSPLLTDLSEDSVNSSSAAQIKAGEMQQNTLKPLIPTVKNERALTSDLSEDSVNSHSATQVKAGEVQQNTLAPLKTTVKNEIVNENALTSNLSLDSDIGPSATQDTAVQQNTLTPLIPTVKNEIVNERALTSDLSLDSEIGPSATQDTAGEVQQNTLTPLIPTVKNEIVNERAMTSDLSLDSEIGPSATQDTTVGVKKSVVPAHSTNPRPKDNREKTKNTTFESVHVASQTTTNTIEKYRQRKEHEIAMKVFELKLKNETDIQLNQQKNHEMAMKVFKMKLKAEEEKLKYYQSLRNPNRPEMDRRVHRFLIPCLVCMFCILYCIM